MNKIAAVIENHYYSNLTKILLFYILNLGQLNVTLATFIMEPTILFTFFGDPEKAQIMMEVQQLLPIFTPEDIGKSSPHLVVKSRTKMIYF